MAPLWKECVEFLRSARLLRESVVIERVEQLAVLLSDGVILCNLVRLLRPESIAKNRVQPSSWRSNYLSSNNIVLFLTACKEFFSVPNEYLFSEEDLSKYQNFEKVLRLISYLSRSYFAVSFGLKSFDETPGSPSEYVNLPDSIEDQYIQLNEKIQAPGNPFEYINLPDAVENQYIQLNEKIQAPGNPFEYVYLPDAVKDEYIQLNETLQAFERCEEKQTEEILNIYVSATPVANRKFPTSEYIDNVPVDERIRIYGLKEMIDFTCDYLKQLNQLAFLYNQFENNVTQRDRDGLFYKISELAHVHQLFYDDLKLAVEFSIQNESQTDSTNSIGSVCQRYKVKFANAYKERIIGLDESNNILKNLLKVNDVVKNALSDQLLRGVLENPIQKICSYGLFLASLLKKSKDKDFQEDIKLAIAAFSDVNHFLNRICSRLELVKNIAKLILNFPESKSALISYGNFKWDDQLDVIRSTKSDNNGSRPEKYQIFLFDAVIIVCMRRNQELIYLEHHELKDFELSQIREVSRWPTTTFQFNLDNHANGRLFNFIFKLKKKCERTHHDFEKVLNILKPKNDGIQKHKIISKRYSTPTTCDECKKIFDVLGYSCEQCHKIFDFDCLKKVPCLKEEENSFLESNIKKSDLLQVVDVQKGEIYAKILGSQNESLVIKLHSKGEVYPIDQFNLPEPSWTQKIVSFPEPLVSSWVLNLPSRSEDLRSKIWYHGQISKEEADQILIKTPTGTFLFRYSDKQNRYVLSVKGPEKPVHIRLGFGFEGQDASIALGTKHFHSFEDYINYFRQKNFETIYENVQINTTLKYALIRTNFKANLVFIMTTTTGENVQIRQGDIITVIDTKNEETGFWKARVNGKVVRIPCALIWEFCESILVDLGSL